VDTYFKCFSRLLLPAVITLIVCILDGYEVILRLLPFICAAVLVVLLTV
jgi:hypothetical protein